MGAGASDGAGQIFRFVAFLLNKYFFIFNFKFKK
jgi:hypothetical protein